MLDSDPIELADISSLILSTSQNDGSEYDCGNLAFKLTSESLESLVTVNVDDGKVATRTITDEALIGEHELKFIAYFIDIDPSALQSFSLPLTLTIQVVKPSIVG